MTNKSLGDYLLDRTESLNDKYIQKYFIERNDVLLSRLLDSEQYLLEGARGVGKTMLMKASMLDARKNFERDSVLAVWISFEESIRLERIRINVGKVDPFLQWTIGKTLLEFLKSLRAVIPSNYNDIATRLNSLFKIKKANEGDFYKTLENYVNLLEKGDLKDCEEVEKNSPSDELIKVLDNPSAFKAFILKTCDENNIERVVFLFDEAAHVFSHSQQENFFNFFKVLRDPKIACKAAVYPGITNYGKFFERGQDAKELRMTWSPRVSADINYIKNIIKKRIQEYDEEIWDSLNRDKRIIETLATCSNGNPRFAFHILDALDESGELSKKINLKVLINAIRRVFETKWKEFGTLKNRLIKYSIYIEHSELFVREVLAPNLLEWNNRRRSEGKSLTSGVYVESTAFNTIPKLFEVLAYSGIIDIDYSKKSIGHGKYGYFVSLNPSLLISDLILKDSVEISKSSIAIENSPAYTSKTNEIINLMNKTKVADLFSCSREICDYKTDNNDFSFCPKCGSAIIRDEPIALYKILRDHSVSELKLSDFLIGKCQIKFKTIGEVYDSSIDILKTISGIKDVRAQKIYNASVEYMAG